MVERIEAPRLRRSRRPVGGAVISLEPRVDGTGDEQAVEALPCATVVERRLPCAGTLPAPHADATSGSGAEGRDAGRRESSGILSERPTGRGSSGSKPIELLDVLAARSGRRSSREPPASRWCRCVARRSCGEEFESPGERGAAQSLERRLGRGVQGESGQEMAPGLRRRRRAPACAPAASASATSLSMRSSSRLRLFCAAGSLGSMVRAILALLEGLVKPAAGLQLLRPVGVARRHLPAARARLLGDRVSGGPPAAGAAAGRMGSCWKVFRFFLNSSRVQWAIDLAPVDLEQGHECGIGLAAMHRESYRIAVLLDVAQEVFVPRPRRGRR